MFPGKDDAVVHDTFSNFYAWNVTYDLVRQWIIQDGPFRYEYKWLSHSEPPEVIKEWAARNFESVWSIRPGAFEIL
jgi:hypothetical protein